MSVRTMARVWAESKHSGSDLLMLLAIADFSDDEGNAYPAVGTLATKCRMSSRNANYVLTSLQQSKELRVIKGSGPRGTNRYRIVLDGVKAAAPLKSSAPLQPASVVGCSPLQGGAEAGFPKPLKPASDKPSMNHQLTINEPSKKKSAAQTFVLPDWIPTDAWSGYVEMRAKIRAPMTTRAMELKVSELERLRNSGQDVGAVLDKSTSNNWKDVYPLKSDSSGKSQSKPWEGAR